jgi:hypothetical protein
METWFEDNKESYETQAKIHEKYVTLGEGHIDAYEGSGNKFGRKEK